MWGPRARDGDVPPRIPTFPNNLHRAWRLASMDTGMCKQGPLPQACSPPYTACNQNPWLQIPNNFCDAAGFLFQLSIFSEIE